MASPLPATEPSQRRKHWADVDALLTRGCLSVTVLFGDTAFCIRSPMEAEFWLLEQMHPNAESWFEYIDSVVARCTWSVDGQVFIEDPLAVQELEKFLRKIHPYLKEVLYYAVLGLMARKRRAERDIYYYCYEDESRLAWRSLRDNISPNESFGLGFDRLGTTLVQRIWQAYNISEDQRIEEMIQWSMTKNIMSCHAPKGVEKIEKKDKQRLETRLSEQQNLLDKFYYRTIGLLDDEGNEREEDPDKLDSFKMAHTPQELADEMHRWVTGEHDQHDKAVADYKEGIRQRMLDERLERDRRLAQVRREAAIAARTFGYDANRPAVVGYSLEQVQKMMREKGSTNVDMPGLRSIGYSPSRRERAFDRWVDGEIDSGHLESVDGALVEGSGEQKTAQSLQEKIQARRPTFNGGDE